jgi:diacylglycerol kinase family enzyme
MLYVRGVEIRVETTPPMTWQADGEIMGTTPFNVVVEPLAVRMLIPARS